MSLHEVTLRSLYMTFEGNLRCVDCAVHEADPRRLQAVILLGINLLELMFCSLSCSIGWHPNALSKLQETGPSLMVMHWLAEIMTSMGRVRTCRTAM